jgi:hypothetical protein
MRKHTKLSQKKMGEFLERATTLISEIKNSYLEPNIKVAVLKVISNKALATKNFLESNINTDNDFVGWR